MKDSSPNYIIVFKSEWGIRVSKHWLVLFPAPVTNVILCYDDLRIIWIWLIDFQTQKVSSFLLWILDNRIKLCNPWRRGFSVNWPNQSSFFKIYVGVSCYLLVNNSPTNIHKLIVNWNCDCLNFKVFKVHSWLQFTSRRVKCQNWICCVCRWRIIRNSKVQLGLICTSIIGRS